MKNTKRNKINLIFSSFLVIGYIVCTYFFSALSAQIAGLWGTVIQLLVLTLFGLLLFYATRVGEGKAVKRFSAAVLLLIDLPALYIILATFADGFPFHNELNSSAVMLYLACVALGYGIPYTFLSGFEMKFEDEALLVEGGIAQELLETAQEDELSQADDDAQLEEASEEPAQETAEAVAEETEENTENAE